MKEAKAMMPGGDITRGNIEAVLSFIHHKDIEIDSRQSMQPIEAGNSAFQVKRFLKNNWAIAKETMRLQLAHVHKGCLSDPEGICVTRVGANGLRCTARSTSSNERDNLALLQTILTATSVGIHRVERLICAHFEKTNDWKKVARLGKKDHGTIGTEKLAILNSMATSVKCPVLHVQISSCQPSMKNWLEVTRKSSLDLSAN